MDFHEQTLNSRIEMLGARILVVEDDITMKPIWLHIIERVGQVAAVNYDVEWVNNVHSALRILSEADTEHRGVDVVISDIFLSGSLTGLDLWRRASDLRDMKPGPRFLMTSVVTPEKFHSWLNHEGAMPLYLQKPLSIEACVQGLHQVWPQTREESW